MSRTLYPPFIPQFGVGAPGAGVPKSACYYDTGTTPFTPYIYRAGAWQTYGASGSGGNATSIQGIPVDTAAPTSGQTLVYDGTKYKPGSAAGTPTVVQAVGGITATSTTVTLPTAPTQGNVLLAMYCGANQALAAGWQSVAATINANSLGYYFIGWRFVGASESATVTVLGANANCYITLFEIAAGAAISVYNGTFTSGTDLTRTLNATAFSTNGLLLGGAFSADLNLPTFTGATATGTAATGSAHSVQPWRKNTPTAGVAANAVVGTWSALAAHGLISVYVQ